MIDLISLIVTLIIMSLFGIGLLFALIIMSQQTPEAEQRDEDEEQKKYIREYHLKKQKKIEDRNLFISNIKIKIKKFFTRR